MAESTSIEYILEEIGEAKKQDTLAELDPDLKELFMPLSTAAIRACNDVLTTVNNNVTTSSFEEAIGLLTPSDSNATKTYKSFYSSYSTLGFAAKNPTYTTKAVFKGVYLGSWVSLFERYKESREGLVSVGKKKFKVIYSFLKKNHYLMQYGQGYGKAIFLMDTPELKLDHLFPILFNESAIDSEYIKESVEKIDGNTDLHLMESVVQRNQELENENRILKLKLQDLEDGFY